MTGAARSRQGGQVLILLFIGGLFLHGSAVGFSLLRGGKSVHDMKKEVRALIPQEDRRKSIDAVLDRWDDAARAGDRHRSQMDKELLALMQRHDAARAEFDQLFGKADAFNAGSRQSLLDLRFAFRQEFSPEEWHALFPPPVSR